MKIKELHAKYERGDSLTDKELADLLEFYDNLVSALDAGFLTQYRLVQQDAWSVQRTLKGYQQARKNR